MKDKNISFEKSTTYLSTNLKSLSKGEEEDPLLVDMFLDLMEIAGKMKAVVHKCVAAEVRSRGDKYGKNFGAEETFDEDINGETNLSKLAEEFENDQSKLPLFSQVNCYTL